MTEFYEDLGNVLNILSVYADEDCDLPIDKEDKDQMDKCFDKLHDIQEKYDPSGEGQLQVPQEAVKKQGVKV